MLKTICVAALAFLSLAPLATAADTTTGSAATKPAAVKKPKSVFHSRMTQIKTDLQNLPPDTTGTIVMLGDSITHGFFTSGVMPETIAGLKVLNQGISGDQIDRPTSGTGVTTRIDLVKQARPAIVFVLIGVNDFWGGKETPEEVIPQYENMFRMLKTELPDTKFVWQSVLPTGMKNSYLNPHVDKLNARIKELATGAGDVYLDLHPIMEDEKGELKIDFSGDGVHLKPGAYQLWLEQVKDQISQNNTPAVH